MSSADKLKRFFKKAELNINSDTDEKVFQDVFDAQQKTIKSESAQPVNIRRMFIKNHFRKFAAAAIIIIACIAGITMLNKTSSIAIADVLKLLDEINSYKYNLTIHAHILYDPRSNPTERTTEYEATVSKDYGTKAIGNSFKNNDANNIRKHDLYFSKYNRSQTNINHSSKQYTQVKINDSLVKPNTDEYTDPYELVERFLTNNYKSLGISDINGIKAEAFQINDEATISGLTNKSETMLYIDIKTSLPIKIVSKTHTEGSGENSDINIEMEITYSDFEWNVPVNPSEFVPVIPEDYTLAVDVGINKEKEDTIIKGLKLYAELFGNYPEELDIGKLVNKNSEVMYSNTPAARKLQEQMKELANEPEKITQLNRERIDLFNATEQYYNMLSRLDTDPEYYGDTVSPGDTDKILIRWKISDDNYRVIFGDLKIETLTREELDSIEKTLPENN